MIETINKWEAKREELNKIEKKLSDEVNRVVSIILKFFAPYDKSVRNRYHAGDYPSSKYLGQRTDRLPSYYDSFHTYDEKGVKYVSATGEYVSATGEYYDYDETDHNTVRFNVDFLKMPEDKIVKILEAEYSEVLSEIELKAAAEKAEAEEKKRLAREKKVEKEKEKLKELLVKYYPGQDMQL